MASEYWGERWGACEQKIARRFMETATRKESLVCLAADRNTMSGMFELIDFLEFQVSIWVMNIFPKIRKVRF